MLVFCSQSQHILSKPCQWYYYLLLLFLWNCLKKFIPGSNLRHFRHPTAFEDRFTPNSSMLVNKNLFYLKSLHTRYRQTAYRYPYPFEILPSWIPFLTKCLFVVDYIHLLICLRLFHNAEGFCNKNYFSHIIIRKTCFGLQRIGEFRGLLLWCPKLITEVRSATDLSVPFSSKIELIVFM